MARPLKYKATFRKAGVEGLEGVIARYREECANLKNHTNRGLVQFALHIRRRTETKPPYTPVDRGNLRASWFIASQTGIVEDVLGFSGDFKTPRKHHITKGELAAQHRAVQAAALSEVRSHNEPNVMFGYSANYAFVVHEKIEAEHWSREGSGPKWLEAHMNGSIDTFKKIIIDNSKIL